MMETLIKEIKINSNKWSDSPCSWTGRLNIVNKSVFSYLIYRLNVFPTKIPENYFVDIDNLVLMFIGSGKWPRIANTILKEKKQSQRTDNTIWLQDLVYSHSSYLKVLKTFWLAPLYTWETEVQSMQFARDEDPCLIPPNIQIWTKQVWTLLRYCYSSRNSSPLLSPKKSAANAYLSLNSCWLKLDKGFIWSFMGPVALIILVGDQPLIFTGETPSVFLTC